MNPSDELFNRVLARYFGDLLKERHPDLVVIFKSALQVGMTPEQIIAAATQNANEQLRLAIEYTVKELAAGGRDEG